MTYQPTIVEKWRAKYKNDIYEGVVELHPIGIGYLWFVRKQPNKFHIFPKDITTIQSGFTFTRRSAVWHIDEYLENHEELHGHGHYR